MRCRLHIFGVALTAVFVAPGDAANNETPVKRTYVAHAAAPERQTLAEAELKSAGCTTCHEKTDAPTMHANTAVILGCTDCHGGDAAIKRPAATVPADVAYRRAQDLAHVLPRLPTSWGYPASATLPRTYTLLNDEAPEVVRFINPGDYQVAREACPLV